MQLKITQQITNRETASLDKYLTEIGREELITAEQGSNVNQLVSLVKENKELVEQMKVWGAAIHFSTAKQHDDAMAFIQVMRHFSSFVYGVHLAQEDPSQTLQPTALVHEAWIKLSNGQRQTWNDR